MTSHPKRPRDISIEQSIFHGLPLAVFLEQIIECHDCQGV
jgi:hypothetical protein